MKATSRNLTAITALFAMGIVAALSGCAASESIGPGAAVRPGAVAAMNPRLKAAVTLREVTGPHEPDSRLPFFRNVGPANTETFRRALLDSLALNGYYTSDPKAARLAVSANVEQLEEPVAGVSMLVRTSVTYVVTGPGGSRSFAIKADGRASPADSLSAADRLRIANERAIRENIRLFLQQLSTLT
jgi:hypothetical protein